jgi:hypothetical protein
MNKWLKIGGIVSVAAIVGVLAWSAVAFAQEVVGPDQPWEAPFGRGRFGGPKGEGFMVFGDDEDGFPQRGPWGHRGGPSFGPGGFAGPLDEGFMALGDGEDGCPRRGPGHRRGLGGEATAVGEGSLTILTRDEKTIEVNVGDETKVWLFESQSEGSLSDIEIGNMVGIRGPKTEDGTVEALGIVVLPVGDKAGGKVTAVDGETISVEDFQGEATIIVTGADTQFRLGRETGSLSDVDEGKLVVAFGEKQDDGALAAQFVIIREAGEHGPGPRQGFRAGEVTGIDGTTFTLNSFRGGEVTVLTDASTQYHTRGDEEVSFENIEVGGKVRVKGEPVEGQEDTVQAEVVGIVMQ